jgi:hypothetical protein
MIITLPVILYDCETRAEHKLRVFEDRVMRRIFGPKRDEVSGGWRKLHNEELHDLYSSGSIIGIIKSRRMKWVGPCSARVEHGPKLRGVTHKYRTLHR